jgi:hypothetical protein
MGKVNAIRRDFPELLTGRYIHRDGIQCSNPELTLRAYADWGEHPEHIAVVATSLEGMRSGRIHVPGYRLVERRTLGEAHAFTSGGVSLRQGAFAVLRFERE